MSTSIQPVPPLVLASEFPSLADRPAGTYNAKAKAWADTSVDMAESLRDIAVNAHSNAVAADERAAMADERASDAENAKEAAETARDKAQEWAESDGEPEPGHKSAKGWSDEAQGWAAQSEGYKDSAAALAAAAGAAAGIPSMEGQEGKVLTVVAGANPGDPPRASWEPGLPEIEGQAGKALVLEPGDDPEGPPVLVWKDIDGRPGEVRRTSEALLPPKWLRDSTSYLRSEYPKTAAFLLDSPPTSPLAQAAFSPNVGTVLETGLTPDGNDLLVVCTTAPVLRAYRRNGASLNQVAVDTQPVTLTSGVDAGPITFSSDSDYACIVIMASDGGVYQSSVCVYHRQASGWVLAASLQSSVLGFYQHALISPDASSVFVSTVGAGGFDRYSFNGSTLTSAGNPLSPFPSDRTIRGMAISQDGKKFAISYSVSVAQLAGEYPGFSIYDADDDGGFVKRPADARISATSSPTFGRLFFSPNGNLLLFTYTYYTGSSNPAHVVAVDLNRAPQTLSEYTVGESILPRNACFLSEEPYKIWVSGEISTWYLLWKNPDSGALVSLTSGAQSAFIALSADGKTASQIAANDTHARLTTYPNTFTVPALLATPSPNPVNNFFGTFLRSYDA